MTRGGLTNRIVLKHVKITNKQKLENLQRKKLWMRITNVTQWHTPLMLLQAMQYVMGNLSPQVVAQSVDLLKRLRVITMTTPSH